MSWLGRNSFRLAHKIRRIGKILRSPYPYLISADPLNGRFHRIPPPILTVLDSSSEFELIQVADISFYWPIQYGHKGLKALYREVFAPANSNPHAYEVGQLQLQAGDWVIDAGTCEGFFTHYALRRGANVLMVEPVPALVEALKLTFAEELRNGRVKLLQGGLGKESGELSLQIPDGKYDQGYLGTSGDIRVPVYTLDQILRENIIPQIDFIKMDIEGGEVDAFEGANTVLKLCKPKLSIAVYHDIDNARMIKARILEQQSSYRVTFRGVFVRSQNDLPRPYMLHAIVST